jgi:hypothetical protein
MPELALSDAYIAELEREVAAVAALKTQVAGSLARLGQGSQSSSKPPSPCLLRLHRRGLVRSGPSAGALPDPG